jgi:hypothetical protein
MFKSIVYLLLMTTAGVLVWLLAAQVPWLYQEEEQQDLRDDLLRARQMADDQHRLRAFEQLVAAQSLAQDARLRGAFGSGEEGSSLDAAALKEALPALARGFNVNVVTVVDARGQVVAAHGEQAPAPGRALEGLPPIEDARAGLNRDWLGRLTEKGPLLLLAASPILLPREGRLENVGAVLVGQPIGGPLAQSLASALEPANSANTDVYVALFAEGRLLGSSATTAQMEELLGNAAASFKDQPLATPWGPNATPPAAQERVFGDRHVTYTVTAMRAGFEGASVGQIIAIERQLPGTNLLPLAARAVTQELPEGVGPSRFIPVAVGMISFLLGLLLITNESARPGRVLLEQLKALEGDLEHRDLPTRPFSGVYRQVALGVNSLLLGLRKRLERERHQHEPLLSEDAFEPLEPLRAPPAAMPTPTPRPPDSRSSRTATNLKALPFSDSGQSEAAPAPQPNPRRIPTGELVEIRPTQHTQLTDEEASARRSSLRNFIIEDLDEAQEEAPPSAVQEAPISQAPAPPADEVQDFFQQLERLQAEEEESAHDQATRAVFEAPVDDDEALREDRTQDIAPDALRGLLRQNKAPSPAPRSLKSLAQDRRSTLVDDEGVIAELASASKDEPLSSPNPMSAPTSPASRQAAALIREEVEAQLQEAEVIDQPRPARGHFDEVTTAELARDDRAFQEMLAASFEESFRNPDSIASELGGASLSPASLTESLHKQAAQPQRPRPGTGERASSGLIDPRQSEETMQARNPFVNQAPTTPGKGPASQLGEEHQAIAYEKLYQEFVKLKEECGEDLEGLTLERFKRKLDHNQATLIERYQCRAVRFQVYIKNGKAALKATPVK